VTIQDTGGGVDLGHGAVEHPDQHGVAVAAAICEVARGLPGGQHGLQGEPLEPLAALQAPFAGGLGGVVQHHGAELKHPDASGARRGRSLQTVAPAGALVDDHRRASGPAPRSAPGAKRHRRVG